VRSSTRVGRELVEGCLNTVVNFRRPYHVVGCLKSAEGLLARGNRSILKPRCDRLGGVLDVLACEIEFDLALQI
jgi:hypothetical protein